MFREAMEWGGKQIRAVVFVLATGEGSNADRDYETRPGERRL
jgi:hypothetical protein